ncbi:phage/plasmid primase, P4 family [Bradyrhizobium sp. Pha-3]|uniref:phage/plasmid primase, P4 family n=1 Tax=Bradyrhizobium TaxID=374 RepID=UPI0035D48D67
MASKPKIASLDVEKRARRLQSHFPGAPNFYTVTYPKKQEPGKLKSALGYKRVPSEDEIASGAPEMPAPTSAYVDHIEGRTGIVVPLCDVATMTTRWGAVDVDVYDAPDKIRELVEAVGRVGLSFTSHLTKSGGLRILFRYDVPVSLQENAEVIRGLSYKLGFSGLKYEPFPPIQDLESGGDPKQLNMPFFGDKYHVIRSISGIGYRYFTLDQWLDRVEQHPLGDQREYYIAESQKHPIAEEKKAAKASRRRANTDAKKGKAYAQHWLGVYCKKLETSVEGRKIEVSPGAKEIEGRNDAVAFYAYHMGQMVAREWITEAEVIEAFETVTEQWGEDRANRAKTVKTLRTQLTKGQREPHDELANKVFMTEDIAAIEFVEVNRDRLRYDIDEKMYYAWNQHLGYWAPDSLTPIYEMIRDFLREQVADEPPKVQARVVTKTFISAIEFHVRHSTAIRVKSNVWNADPLLLGAPGCTIDLRTGQTRSPIRGDFVTRVAAVAPAETSDCPHWIEFVRQITRGDEGYARFLQLGMGYSLIGDNRENKLFYLHGYTGSNGKGLVLRTLGWVLGRVTSGTGLHFAAPESMFASSSVPKPSYDLASARHARVITVDENPTDKFWNEEFVKNVTGGVDQTARALYQNNVTFDARFTPWFAGQSLPRIRNVDGGIKRRVLIFPFMMHATERPEEVSEAEWVFLKDVELEAKLRAELPAILRWMVDGTLLYHERRFHRLPAIVQETTDEFFYAEDHLGRFMENGFARTKNPADRITAASIYESYRFTMERAGQFPESQGQFTKKLQDRGYETVKVDGYRVFVKLQWRRAEKQPPDELPI